MKREPIFTTEGTINPLVHRTTNGDIYVCTEAQYVRLFAYNEDPDGILCASMPLENNDDPTQVSNGTLLYVAYELKEPFFVFRNGSISESIGGYIQVVFEEGLYAVVSGGKYGDVHLWNRVKGLNISEHDYFPPGLFAHEYAEFLVDIANKYDIKVSANDDLEVILEKVIENNIDIDPLDIISMLETPYIQDVEETVKELAVWMESIPDKFNKKYPAKK